MNRFLRLFSSILPAPGFLPGPPLTGKSPVWKITLFRFPAVLAAAAILAAPALSAAPENPRLFQVIEAAPGAETDSGPTIVRRSIRGVEYPNNSLNRLSLLSEDQARYPAPASGCGPVAMLNILVWYEKFGLLEPFTRNADAEAYKQRLFREIDQRLEENAGVERAVRGGTDSVSVARTMDELARGQSGGRVRIETRFLDAPLKRTDFLQTMPDFRSGYLIVRPRDPESGELLGAHAATFLRADRSGYITLGTWGEYYRGLLRERNGEQWFIPGKPGQLDLKVLTLVRFTPFRPEEAVANR